jgi:hypothetical protein
MAPDVPNIANQRLETGAGPQPTSFKQQASSNKLQAASRKLQATSSKPQASSRKLQALEIIIDKI